ncbi:N-acetylglutamate synthase, fungal [Penicillium griseofulvum]|uniref:Amino-acid acetyltransferase, mitochondrial n=1 Tax=Penicillium patulum TaxID=5078 RepID=A0A135LBI6_PENPA|nr:N-acetylglutamate synthase, fungal [Penicillium griseofulvum]KXG46309.1 N-acetylglutamate synthase, fungal [Penicillium griseofulvum]
MSSRTLNWSRTAKSSLVKQHLVRPNDPIAARPAQALNVRTQQVAEFSGSSENRDRLGHRAKEKLLDREFFLSLLNSASTKREAKSYLARLKASPAKSSQESTSETPKESISASLPSGVNLGSFHGASRAVYDSPVFRQDTTPTPRAQDIPERLHLALIKIATPQLLDDSVINGVAKTLSQLVRLGMACCVVVDPGKMDGSAARQTAIEQANRISAAVDDLPDSKSFRLDSTLSISERSGQLSVLSRKVLLSALRDGHVVLVPPIAYMEENPRAITVSANDAAIALTKEFAGLSVNPDPDEDPVVTVERINALQREVSLDRVIVLDPLGGIPAFKGPQSSHVFINMEQEFDQIEDELSEARSSVSENNDFSEQSTTESTYPISESNPFSKFVNRELVSPAQPTAPGKSPGAEAMTEVLDGHLENLRLAQQALTMLPSASSGIITSPQEVSHSARSPQEAASDLSAVGTRRQRNPLIHHLLTDKPLLSSSLPPGRRGVSKGNKYSALRPPVSHTTFVKRGMPLTILPNPYTKPWTAHIQPRLGLHDPSIDLPRLVTLIEDSFDRKLDVQNYLDRVNSRIAGVIVAGEYEGGAILTWETPPGVPDDGSEASAARMVPYLDKFAVLKRSQGAGGVADIVFNAMVRTCFPNGVCWRSRMDNPVNKWYFERSLGTWKLADSNWTMFWTTPGLVEDTQRFQDYEAVCRSIQPSWADKKSVID